jgi:hypothetical protein
MEDWILIQNFYHGLVSLDRSHLDDAAGGAFFLLSVADAKTLIEKWFLTKDAATIDSNPVNEVCIQLRKLTCLQLRWIYSQSEWNIMRR